MILLDFTWAQLCALELLCVSAEYVILAEKVNRGRLNQHAFTLNLWTSDYSDNHGELRLGRTGSQH
jgi:hypothetical protein